MKPRSYKGRHKQIEKLRDKIKVDDSSSGKPAPAARRATAHTDVTCKVCRAGPGYKCQNSSGKAMNKVHRQRMVDSRVAARDRNET